MNGCCVMPRSPPTTCCAEGAEHPGLRALAAPAIPEGVEEAGGSAGPEVVERPEGRKGRQGQQTEPSSPPSTSCGSTGTARTTRNCPGPRRACSRHCSPSGLWRRTRNSPRRWRPATGSRDRRCRSAPKPATGTAHCSCSRTARPPTARARPGRWARCCPSWTVPPGVAGRIAGVLARLRERGFTTTGCSVLRAGRHDLGGVLWARRPDTGPNEHCWSDGMTQTQGKETTGRLNRMKQAPDHEDEILDVRRHQDPGRNRLTPVVKLPPDVALAVVDALAGLVRAAHRTARRRAPPPPVRSNRRRSSRRATSSCWSPPSRASSPTVT